MELRYKLVYSEIVVKEDIKTLWYKEKEFIKNAIEKKLISKPEVFWIPLRKSLNWFRKLRVWDYRVVFKIDWEFVKILAIKHRSVVYKKAEGRI